MTVLDLGTDHGRLLALDALEEAGWVRPRGMTPFGLLWRLAALPQHEQALACDLVESRALPPLEQRYPLEGAFAAALNAKRAALSGDSAALDDQREGLRRATRALDVDTREAFLLRFTDEACYRQALRVSAASDALVAACQSSSTIEEVVQPLRSDARLDDKVPQFEAQLLTFTVGWMLAHPPP